METTYTVHPRGGNQYEVISEDTGETTVIDLDGMTVMSDEDYDRLEDLGLLRDDMFSYQHSEGDRAWAAAVEYAVNYSGWDIDAYIAEQEE
jgi:hypothetical protein